MLTPPHRDDQTLASFHNVTTVTAHIIPCIGTSPDLLWLQPSDLDTFYTDETKHEIIFMLDVMNSIFQLEPLGWRRREKDLIWWTKKMLVSLLGVALSLSGPGYFSQGPC